MKQDDDTNPKRQLSGSEELGRDDRPVPRTYERFHSDGEALESCDFN